VLRRPIQESVATIVNGELWDDEQTVPPSHDGIAPTIGAPVSQDDAVLEGLDLGTRIRCFLGGALVDDENRGTRVLEEDESGKTLRPAGKRARLGGLALPSSSWCEPSHS
jgi:hypothetical protein